MKKYSQKQKLLNEYNFNTYVLEGLRVFYPIKHKKHRGLYVITTNTYGKIDMFPKADRLMFHNSEKWLNGAAEWLCNNL